MSALDRLRTHELVAYYRDVRVFDATADIQEVLAQLPPATAGLPDPVWLAAVGFVNVYEDRWHSPKNAAGEMLMHCPKWEVCQWAFGTPDGCGSIPGEFDRAAVVQLCAAVGVPLTLPAKG